MTAAEEILTLSQIKKHYPVRTGLMGLRTDSLRAVDGVSLKLHAGETLALVGESGCGKSTTARLALGLIEPTGGEIRFRGEDIAGTNRAAKKAFYRSVQVIFQDPSGALNPRKSVYRALKDPMLLHGLATRADARSKATELLERVGLQPASSYLDRFPKQLSGGQRQRVVIARALALEPALIVADEPVSALDVSVRAQILELLRGLQAERGLGYLLITHDLSVVRSVAQRVAVMYMGKIVESGPTSALFEAPKHPYTRSLLRATPLPDPVKARQRVRKPLVGEVPSPTDPPSGCRFRTRCPIARPVCAESHPPLEPFADRSHAACFATKDASWPKEGEAGLHVTAQ